MRRAIGLVCVIMDDQCVPYLEGESCSTAGSQDTPPEWQHQENMEETFHVLRGSCEWNNVQKPLSQTLPQASVSAIEYKILWIWTTHSSRKKNLHRQE